MGNGKLYYSTESSYASAFTRFMAYLVDIVIIMFMSALLSALTHAIAAAMNAPPGKVPMISSILLVWLYFALSHSSSKQATVGMMIVGVKISDEQMQPIGFGRATFRFFVSNISGLILYIGYIMMFFSEKKQTLHDVIADTVVVHT